MDTLKIQWYIMKKTYFADFTHYYPFLYTHRTWASEYFFPPPLFYDLNTCLHSVRSLEYKINMCHKELVWKDGTDFWPGSLINALVPPILWFISQHAKKKQKNNNTDLCSGDFVPCTICTQDQRESHNHKEVPLKGSREASANFSYFSQWSFCDLQCK